MNALLVSSALRRSADCSFSSSAVSPKGDSLFFASPKKSKQKKGDPDAAVLRTALRCSGRGALRNSLAKKPLAQTVLAQKTPSPLRFSAPPKGLYNDSTSTDQPHHQQQRALLTCPPLEVPRSAVLQGAVREDCLSAASSAAPLKREHRRAVRSTTGTGCVFFGYFLCTSKESDSPQGEKALKANPQPAKRVSANSRLGEITLKPNALPAQRVSATSSSNQGQIQ